MKLQLSLKAGMIKTIVFIAIIMIVGVSTTKAQQPKDSVMIKLIALRDDFVGKIKAMGYPPTLKAPEVIMDNPRSFGNYDNETNILHTGDWKTLPPQLQALFENAAKGTGSGMTGERYFELSAHQWIFIHELGHWWRACQHQTAGPYENEKAANRIATAYWRERDPAFYDFKLKGFQHIVSTFPNPVPAGQSKEKYLDENYEKLPGASAYTWYQAIMIVEASNEKPIVTFKQAIARSGKASDQ